MSRKRKKQKPITVLAPADLDIPEEFRDHARYYLSVIINGVHSKRNEGRDDFPLDSQLLRSLLGKRKESQVRHWLLDEEVIYIAESHSTKLNRCKRYGIHPRHLVKKAKFEILDPVLSRKIREHRDSKARWSKSKYPTVIKHVEKWENQFDVDLKGCTEKVKRERPGDELELLRSIEEIHEHEVRVNVDILGERIHSTHEPGENCAAL